MRKLTVQEAAEVTLEYPSGDRLARAREIRQRLCLAVIYGDSRPEVMDEICGLSREISILQDADNLRRRRGNGDVWAWPANAPWSGF